MAADALRPTGLLRVLLLTLAFALAAGAAVAPSTARAQNFTIVPPNPYLEASHLVEAQYSWGHGWYYACDEWGFCSFESYNNQPSGAFYFRVNGGDQTAALPTYSDNTTCETTADGGEACTTTVVKRGTAALAEEQRNTLEVGLGTVTGHVYTYDPPPAVYAVDVTPDGGWWETMDAYTTRTFTITFKNTGNRRTTYYPRALACNGAASCSINSHTEILARGESRTFTLTAQAGAPGTEAHPRVRVYHYGDGIERYDDAWVSIRVPHVYGVAVTPDEGLIYVGSYDTTSYAFTVKNAGSKTEHVKLTVTSCPSPLTSCQFVGGDTIRSLPANGTATARVAFRTGAPSHAWAQLGISAAIVGQQVNDAGGIAVSVNKDKSPAAVSLAAHSGRYRSTSTCMADCFEAVVTHRTPAYVSMDRARRLSFQHRSEQASPVGRLTMDLSEQWSAGARPTQYALTLTAPSGAAVHFLGHGADVTRIHTRADTGGRPVRINAMFSVASLPTGVHFFTARVFSYFPAVEEVVLDTTFKVPILVIREDSSDFGHGWSLTGQQRIRSVGADTALVLEGDGSAMLYIRHAPCATSDGATVCTLAPPPGEYSTLRRYIYGTAAAPDSIRWQRQYLNRHVISFDELGRQTRASDPFKNRTTYAYTGAKLTTITDPAGKSIILTYNAEGRLYQVTDPGNRKTTFTYDALKRVETIVDPDSRVALRINTWDADNRIVTYTDRQGATYTHKYDQTASLQEVLLATVDSADTTKRPVIKLRSLAQALLPSGPTSYTSPRPAILADTVTAAVTDPRNNATRMAIGASGLPIRIIGAKRHALVIDRDSLGRDTLVRWSNGTRVYSKTYVAASPLLSEQFNYADAQHVVFSWDTTWAVPNAISILYPAEGTGMTQQFMIGAGGRVDSSQTGSGSWTRYEYYADGRIRRVVDPGGHATESRVATTGFRNTDTTIAAGNRRTAFAHDGLGRVVQSIDPNGRRTKRAFDNMNRVTWKVGPAGDSVVALYGAVHPQEIRDAMGQRTIYAYNAHGWVTKRQAPDITGTLRTLAWQYDVSGNLLAFTNRRGGRSTFRYDTRGRVDSIAVPRHDGSLEVQRFVYDTARDSYAVTKLRPRPQGGADTLSVDRVHRDTAGRDTAAVFERMIGGIMRLYRLGIQRDRVTGAPTSYDLRGSDTTQKHIVSYEYDGELKLLRSMTANSRTVTVWQNGDGEVTSMTYPFTGASAATQTLAYNSTHGVSDQAWNVSALHAAFGEAYQRDALGRISESSGAARADSLRRFTYSGGHRLTAITDVLQSARTCQLTEDVGRVCTGGTETILARDSIWYDVAGNRQDSTAVVRPVNRVTRFGGDTLIYDVDGNVVRRERRDASGAIVLRQHLKWNAVNTLEEVHTVRPGVDSTVVAYDYDGLGRRMRRTAGTAVTHYLWGGGNVLAEMEGTAGTFTTRHAYLPGLDSPVAVWRGSFVYWVVRDGLGNVIGLVAGDATQSVAARYYYSAYGKERAGSYEPFDYAYGYKARELDPLTGLYYMRARYYDPVVGRFMSEDPVHFAGGMNLYEFASSDPVSYADPLGLWPDWQWLRGMVFEAISAVERYIRSRIQGIFAGLGLLGEPDATGAQRLGAPIAAIVDVEHYTGPKADDGAPEVPPIETPAGHPDGHEGPPPDNGPKTRLPGTPGQPGPLVVIPPIAPRPGDTAPIIRAWREWDGRGPTSWALPLPNAALFLPPLPGMTIPVIP